jgi:hypothetical protein
LIAHACIRIESQHSLMLCDPWFSGYAFNDGWRLEPVPDPDKISLDGLTHIWISHEHPDHLHFPTLKAIADRIDPASVEVLFQATNSKKVFNALSGIGFTRHRVLRHLERSQIDEQIQVFVYAHRHLDSCLGVIFEGKNALLNINDTELNLQDCKIIRQKFGTFRVLFNQFSIAGFEGYFDREQMEINRVEVLDKLVQHHRNLGADITVPFASYMSFAKLDNHELNEFANTSLDAKAHLESYGCQCVLIAPTSGRSGLDDIDADDATDYYRRYYRTRKLQVDSVESVAIEDCALAFARRTGIWKSNTNPFIYGKIREVTAYVEDLRVCVALDFQQCQLLPREDLSSMDCDLRINSQPLYQAFFTLFGIQTLGVSGRYRFERQVPSWKLVRIISSLSNAEVFLSLRGLVNLPTIRWAWNRRHGLFAQIRQQIERFA